jgi:hypothetical protein
MSFAEFTNNKNKGVLWGLLQEGGVFNNIPSTMFQNVKNIFEMSILSMKPEFDLFFDKNDEGDDDYDKKAAEMIVNSNKSVIKKVIYEVNKIKAQNENSVKQMLLQNQMRAQPQAQAPISQNQLPIPMPIHLKPSPPLITPIPAPTKKPKIEEIYRADDIKKTRMSELEIRLKEKQTEMDTMLNNKKPEQIDFSDKALGINKESDLYDKKLASDEMDRLLAETLASRERELEKLNIDSGSYNKNAGNDSGDIPVNKIITKRPRESKSVTFNDADNTKVEYEKQENGNGNGNGDGDGNRNRNVNEELENNDDNTMSFFSKLKLKTEVSTPLDDIMNSRSGDDGEDGEDGEDGYDEEEKEIMQLQIQEMASFNRSRETRETRETKEIQQMREMQRYIILEQKIKEIQSNMNEIKKNQELILSILEKKLQ